MTTIALLGALQGIMIALFMFFKKGNRLANRSAALSTMFSVLQMFLVLNFDKLEGSHFLLNVKFYVWANAFLIPPFYYFYVKFITSERPRLRGHDLLHFLPFFVSFILVSPFFVLPIAEKIAFANIGNRQFVFISKVAELGHALSILGYGVTGLGIVRRFQKNIRNEFSNLDHKQMKWLSSLSILFSVIGLAGILGSSSGLADATLNHQAVVLNLESANLTFGVITLVFYFIAYNFMTQPEVFGYEYQKKLEPTTISDNQLITPKYARSNIDLKQMSSLAGHLLVYMEEKKPYLQPDLNAEELARGIQISKHTLSQLLSGHFKKNFFDFINGYRIEEAKKRLIDPNYTNITIRGIASDSGFKSKSTFYSLFKTYTGISPTEFQAKHLNQ